MIMYIVMKGKMETSNGLVIGQCVDKGEIVRGVLVPVIGSVNEFAMSFVIFCFHLLKHKGEKVAHRLFKHKGVHCVWVL